MSESNTPPIKRHPALQPLSRDHYVGLVQGQHLIRAAEGDAVARRQAVGAFLDAWQTEVAVHFDDEERLLAPLLEPGLRDRLLQEHDDLRKMVESIRSQRREVDPDAALLEQAGRALYAHIRWEERELFNALQQSLSPEQVETLATETARVEASRPRSVSRPKPGDNPNEV